jgi:hypothetical protein
LRDVFEVITEVHETFWFSIKSRKQLLQAK